MLNLVGKIKLLIILILVFVALRTETSFASSNCSLCILEIGTAAEYGEEYDFVIIGNSTASSISLSSIQLQYFNNLGVYDSKINLSGTLLAGQTKIFVSEEIKKYNPSSSSLSFSLFSGGGSLKLIKVLTSSTTEYDTVGWGLTVLSESAPVSPNENYIFYRNLNINNEVIDTGNNANDFINSTDDCDGIKINEVQPFATDFKGEAIESWVELIVLDRTMNECSIVTNEGKFFTFDASSLGEAGDIFAINSVINDGLLRYLELPNPSGSVSIATKSKYFSSQPVFIPADKVDYTDLIKNQSYAVINEYGFDAWKKTYQPTPNEENIFADKPFTTATGDPNACSTIYINEIIPNPISTDTGSEWLEIINTSNEVQELEQCVIEIDSEKYYFLDDSLIGPGSILRLFNLYNEDGDEKSIYLRNSDETYVVLSRIYAEEFTLLQSFTYTDAPEGLSYSRFESGWAWTYALTPNEVNIYQSSKPSPKITESKANFANSVAVTSSNAVKKSTTAAKKTTTSNKTLASTAKATTGAKSTSERDVYQEPEELPSSNSNYVFVVLGVLAILYAIYEYKIDIQNFYYKWRRNKALSQEDRQAS